MPDIFEEAFISGDERAVAAVIDKYAPLTAAVIRNLSGGTLSQQDVEELVSDSFISLWQNRDKIQSGRLRGYLCTIAKNKTRDLLRKRREVVILDPDDEDIEDGMRVETELENRELSERLSEALSRLDETDREIIVRHYYYYQTTAVIAEKTGMNQKTVQTRLIRARNKLKEILTEMGVSL